MDHVQETKLALFVERRLAPEERDSVEQHLDECESCRRVVGVLAGRRAAHNTATTDKIGARQNGSYYPSLIDKDEGSDSTPAAEPFPRIGRFEIGDRLGAGGMGIVYRAFDPELGRQIALKVVRRSTPETNARHQREARAMAQISHRNVVAIYDVGTHDGQLFLVMELIAGTNLAEWLRTGDHGWQTVVAMFIDAGRGLAAAHAAGLIHRDFKPHNVLVGTDGRVCVNDFGLVREASDDQEVEPIGDISSAVAVTPLTSAGRLLGTPAYMALEQLVGATADARSDQFAFAIALWEALYGERPFAGDSTAEIVAEMRAGRVRAPRNRKVPGYVHRALLRSLASDSNRRWPNMEALLAGLSGETRRTQRRVAAGAVAVCVAATVAVLWGHIQAASARADAAATCAKPDNSLAGVWDDARKREVHPALLATGQPFAADIWQRVEPALDRYAADWRAARVQACEDTRVRTIASTDVLDRRERCLADRRIELRALVDTLAGVDATMIARAPTAVAALQPARACLERDDGTGIARPWDPAVADRVSTLWARYAKAQSMYQLGRYRDAAGEAKAALDAARDLGFAPLNARLGGILGSANLGLGELPAARQQLTLAAAEAERANNESLHLELLAKLVVALNNDNEHREEVDRWIAMIRAGMMRLDPVARCDVASQALRNADTEAGANQTLAASDQAVKLCEAIEPADDDRVARALTHRAAIQLPSANQDAMTALERALVLADRSRGPDHPDNAAIHNALALNRWRTGDQAAALEHGLRALQILDANQLENSDTVDSLGLLVELDQRQGKDEEALANVHRLREVCARVFGARSAKSAWAMSLEGQTLSVLNRFDEALKVLREARELTVATLGSDAIELGHVDYRIGQALAWQGHTDEARRALEATLDFLTLRGKGTVPSDTALWVLMDLGDVERDVGNIGQALTRYRAALEMAEHADAASVAIVEPLTAIGELQLDQRRPRDAVAPLERAVAQLDHWKGSPFIAAQARFALARAMWLSGGDRTRALELARTARDAYGQLSEQASRARVDAWLAGKHGP
jgi:tetratricopeptide (TPR) repeat protein